MRIQRNNKLNEIWYALEEGPGGAYHDYYIGKKDATNSYTDTLCEIHFQKGPRKDESSRHGVVEADLLEIVRHRLQAFQKGPYATRENACALTHIEEALMWMAKRSDDRAERGVLGTMNK